MKKFFVKLLGILSVAIPFFSFAKISHAQISESNKLKKDFALQSMDALDEDYASMRLWIV